MMIKRIVFGFLIFSSLTCSALELANFDQVRDLHRSMLLLLEKSPSQDPLSDYIFAARNAYAAKQVAIHPLLEAIPTNNSNGLTPVTKLLIQYTQNTLKNHPADLLAFSDLFDELEAAEAEHHLSSTEQAQWQTSLKAYKAVLKNYRADYTKTLDKLTRGEKLESWADYINFLSSQQNVRDLLQTYGTEQASLFRYRMRGEDDSKNKKDELTEQTPKIVWGNGLPEKTVVLTFDDGPHARNTPAILDILKQYEVHGYFFSLGQNLGESDGKTVTSTRNDEIVKRILNEGNIIANHSYSHAVLTKLDQAHRKAELEKTNAILNKSLAQPNGLFRPPYGSRDKELDALATKDGLISVMWNVDSMDWADPIPESIADRTLQELEKNKKGILLFHDIHKQSVAALPTILTQLAERGYRVVTLDGESFANNASGLPKVQATQSNYYGKSWALVIGINDYQSWPKLKYAVNDAKAVAESLNKKLGFAKENIITLYDQDATSERISEVLGYQLADPKLVGENDRVFIFYAGHGATRELPGGKSLGYIIPADADTNKFQNRGISMTQLNDFSAMIPAKHVFFVMDSCYSGLALTRAGVSVGQSVNYLQQITSRKARQILTAGGGDQQVSDSGPGGHSIFTWTFLQAIEGLADTDNNGYVTASELGTYVAPVVSSYADQTPAFGNMLGSEGGDFVFKIDGNAVAEINQKLQQDSKRVEDEINSLRQNTSANMKRRLELEIALDKEKNSTSSSSNANAATNTSSNRVAIQIGGLNAAGAVNNQTSSVSSASNSTTTNSTANKSATNGVSTDRKARAAQLNTLALEYFKNKHYEEAKKELAEAVRLNPYNPTIVNNYAFMLDQLNENEEALKWYYRTLELDPKRIPLYLNLGDIMVKTGRKQESVPYYERYLHLYPSYKDAKQLIEKMEEYRKANN